MSVRKILLHYTAVLLSALLVWTGFYLNPLPAYAAQAETGQESADASEIQRSGQEADAEDESEEEEGTLEEMEVASGGYSIMGYSSVTARQLADYYRMSGYSYPSFYGTSDAPDLLTFCSIYVEECNAEGVKAEVAFCQAMLETAFLRYGGQIDISQYNFAGIGALDGCIGGASFPDVRTGIRAQVQHLKAYASTDGLNNACVDPRFQYVNRGCASTVESLGGGHWASDKTYGSKIHSMITELWNVSGSTTVYNNVDYSAVYDPDYYMAHNPDVVSAFGGDPYQTLAHFVQYGMSEGRQGNEEFNVFGYRNRYSDLRQRFGNNLKEYYLHYISNGRAEGRIASYTSQVEGAVTILNGVDYSAVYDYNYYVEQYSDVRNAFGSDEKAVLAHFVQYGMKEGRQGNQTFNVTGYKNRYMDLRNEFGNNLQTYYLHYIMNGKAEGRDASYTSNVSGKVTKLDGMDYSAVYDGDYYAGSWKDVSNAFGNDDIAILRHFVSYGMKEGRQAKKSFDVYKYKSNYSDLRNAFGNNLKLYYLHYISYGIKEGRNGA